MCVKPPGKPGRPGAIDFRMTRFTHEPTILAHEIVVGQMLEVNARPAFDGAPILKELVERYQNEVR